MEAAFDMAPQQITTLLRPWNLQNATTLRTMPKRIPQNQEYRNYTCIKDKRMV